MIIDQFSETTSFNHLPWFAAVREYVSNNNLHNADAGRYDIDGDDLFVIIADDTARDAHPPLEAHRSYIDLQLAIEGSFDVLWRPLAECNDLLQPYSLEDDVLLMSDAATTRLTINEGIAAVFFPGDAHAPQPPSVSVRKAVFKIKVP
ncbi:MAG: YhcH/YjgK/YiaL family protein [Candidatus Kapabacteria bacterium]|nr:YhcH/YjgK/YiaL family protein [Candidatus Kapabacteria bacterium]